MAERDVQIVPNLDYEIDVIGGQCPLQATGTVGMDLATGKPFEFYFRSRGQGWSFVAAETDPLECDDSCFEVEGRWGGEMYDAGYMNESDARNIIALCAILFGIQEFQTQVDVYRRKMEAGNG